MFLGEIGTKFVNEGLFPKAAGIEPYGRVSGQNPLYILTNEGQGEIEYAFSYPEDAVERNREINIIKTNNGNRIIRCQIGLVIEN